MNPIDWLQDNIFYTDAKTKQINDAMRKNAAKYSGADKNPVRPSQAGGEVTKFADLRGSVTPGSNEPAATNLGEGASFDRAERYRAGAGYPSGVTRPDDYPVAFVPDSTIDTGGGGGNRNNSRVIPGSGGRVQKGTDMSRSFNDLLATTNTSGYQPFGSNQLPTTAGSPDSKVSPKTQVVTNIGPVADGQEYANNLGRQGTRGFGPIADGQVYGNMLENAPNTRGANIGPVADGEAYAKSLGKSGGSTSRLDAALNDKAGMQSYMSKFSSGDRERAANRAFLDTEDSMLALRAKEAVNGVVYANQKHYISGASGDDAAVAITRDQARGISNGRTNAQDLLKAHIAKNKDAGSETPAEAQDPLTPAASVVKSNFDAAQKTDFELNNNSGGADNPGQSTIDSNFMESVDFSDPTQLAEYERRMKQLQQCYQQLSQTFYNSGRFDIAIVANSDINRGAGVMASLNLDGQQQNRLREAARLMNMNERDAAAMVGRAMRKINRGENSNTPVDQVIDQFLRRGQGVNAVNADLPANIDDLRSIPNREVEFGEFGNQDELQNFGGRDDQGNIGDVAQQIKELEQAQGRKDPNVLARNFFEKGKEGLQREEMYIPDGMPVPERFVEAAKNRDFGIYQEGVPAPAAQVQRIERDALQQGVDQFGADAFPGAADVIGRIDDDIQGNSAAEQSLVREMIGQERDGLAGSEIRRRADLQLREEFGGDQAMKDGGARAMPIDAYQVREQQILSDLGRIRQNSEAVEANNWRAAAEANLIGQDFQVGGRGARADAAMEGIGNIAKLGHAKVAYDFQVNDSALDRSNAIPDSLAIDLPDQYNSPVTDNRFAGPLQKQEQWLVDALGGIRDPNIAGAYPDVGINEQIGLARQAVQNAKMKGQRVDLGDMRIQGLTDLQAAVDQVLELGRKRGQPFFNNVDGKNVVNRNPGIGEVLERGGMNARQIGDVAKAMFAVEAARRNPANQGRKELFAEGVTIQPMVNKINFGGDHPALGGGEARIAMVNREKIEGREVGGQLRKLDGRKGNPGEPLNQQELAQARMPFQAGVAGQAIPRARFVRGEDVNLSTDAIYEKYGPVNGQVANAVLQRARQAEGSNPDGFGMRAERQRNMDPGPAFDPGPDPWSTPPATGNGITQEISKRSAASPQAALPYGIDTNGAKQGPRISGGFLGRQAVKDVYGSESTGKYAPFDLDEDTTVRPSPRRVRQEASILRNKRYGRNAAIAGGGVAALAGIDGLIGGERDRREQEAN